MFDMAAHDIVAQVFMDFWARRNGLTKALTTDFQKLCLECDPKREGNLCLYGTSDGKWEVKEPPEEVPADLPDPTTGINFIRDDVEDKRWMIMVAAWSDVWLLSIAFFHALKFGLPKDDRMCLFTLINELPTLTELVAGEDTSDQLGNSTTSTPNQTRNKSNRSKAKGVIRSKLKQKHQGGGSVPKRGKGIALGDDDDDDETATLCWACQEKYESNEFWICCDSCDKWFHGKCVEITAYKAKQIKQYKCPLCSSSSSCFLLL